ncbi:MAG: tetratricopeptide repeat protein [Nitrososphaerota archaeon]|jgi:tetratricopeptide (TPR) repeat protein|nr:tetratricopeptide repeat protein [Nitrososphaerota archaeon]
MSDKKCGGPREDCVDKFELVLKNEQKLHERLSKVERDVAVQGECIGDIGANVSTQDKLYDKLLGQVQCLNRRMGVLEHAEASRLIKRKEYDRAIELLDNTIHHDVSNSPVWLSLIWAYLLKGDKKCALDTVNKALEKVPEQARPVFNFVKFDIIRRDSSYEEFRLYLTELNSGGFVVFDEKDLAQVFNDSAFKLYECEKDLYEAVELSQKAIDRDPTNACGYDTKACILVSLGRYNEALVFFEKALKFRCSWREVTWGVLCQVYGRLGMTADAKWAEERSKKFANAHASKTTHQSHK